MELIDNLVKKTIPIYTLRKPHPVKKRPDCSLTRDYKLRLRDALRKELSKLPQYMWNKPIDQYAEKVREL